jgi:hypothetical protein
METKIEYPMRKTRSVEVRRKKLLFKKKWETKLENVKLPL